MAVFRIEKTRDYTVMSNYHLRDRSLSLKAKGLLSLMLSLPEDWDYTMKGLARICKDGIDSISGGIRELEAHGYLVRARVRNENGQLGSIEYTILEQPKEPAQTPAPIREKPKHARMRLRDEMHGGSRGVPCGGAHHHGIRCINVVRECRRMRPPPASPTPPICVVMSWKWDVKSRDQVPIISVSSQRNTRRQSG